MIKVGHDLNDAEIEQRYTAVAASLSMPRYFYSFVARFAPSVSALRVLDVGCGNGQLLAELIHRFPGSHFWGTELSSGRLRLARQCLGYRVSLLQTDGDGYIPFKDNAFDLIFVTEVIEHLKQPVLFLQEIYRILAPSGRLVLTTPNSDAFPLWPYFAALAERYPDIELLQWFLPYEHPTRTVQPIDTVLSSEEVRSLLCESGFTPLRLYGRESFPFLFALPGFRGLDYRGLLPRSYLDIFCNKLGLKDFCYRMFWECRKV
jgi:SAM-dependent methyltransferase